MRSTVELITNALAYYELRTCSKAEYMFILTRVYSDESQCLKVCFHQIHLSIQSLYRRRTYCTRVNKTEGIEGDRQCAVTGLIDKKTDK